MKNVNRFQKVLIWILVIIFSFTIVLSMIKPNFISNINEGVFNLVTAVRYTLFEKPINNVNGKFDEIMNLDSITKENQLLKENQLSYGRQEAYIKELEEKNKELNDMLEFKDNNSVLNLVSSRVIFRDFNRWNNTIKINVGSTSNVAVNDAVILPEGLIGRIESVSDNTSIVRLLISPDKTSKVAVKIDLGDNEYVEAIIDEYDSDNNAFVLSLLDTNDNIEVGNNVVTSGAGGLIPAGIKVGQISVMEDSINQLGSHILVKSNANFSSFENVFVVVGSNND